MSVTDSILSFLILQLPEKSLFCLYWDYGTTNMAIIPQPPTETQNTSSEINRHCL